MSKTSPARSCPASRTSPAGARGRNFVFAADLLRALARQGLSLPTEFLWLRAYEAKTAGEVTVLAGPGEAVRGKSVLLIDGVLDRGATIVKARALLKDAGAKSVLTAVAVDKLREDALAHADFALFHGVTDFIAGYGMDHAGAERGLPDIVRVGYSSLPVIPGERAK